MFFLLSVFLLLLLLLLARGSSVTAFWLWRLKQKLKRKKKMNEEEEEEDGLPRGTMGWPLLGETLRFLASKPSLTSQPFIEERMTRYGSVFKSCLFGQPFIISTDAEVNHFILGNEGVYFKCCQPIHKYREILGFYTLNETYGELHKKIHDVSTSMLKQERLKSHGFDVIQDLIWRRLVSWQDQIVHVQHEASHIVLCLMLNHLIGLSPNDVDMEMFYEYCNDVKSLLSFPFNIPGSRRSKHLRGCKNISRLLEERIQSRSNSDAKNPEDFLGALLEVVGSDAPSSKSTLILDIIRGILFHAEETTSIAMTLLLRFISKSPDVLELLKKEHSTIKKSEQISWDDYQSMHFTANVINESLRLANVVPWVVRVAEKDVKIKGFVIPKGWKVLAFLMNTHLDERMYDYPKSFNPLRWQNTTHSPPHFMPFGHGPRCCPGAEMTKITLAIFLRVLVTKYSWELVEDDELIRFPILTFQEGQPIAVTSIDNADECLILH